MMQVLKFNESNTFDNFSATVCNLGGTGNKITAGTSGVSLNSIVL